MPYEGHTAAVYRRVCTRVSSLSRPAGLTWTEMVLVDAVHRVDHDLNESDGGTLAVVTMPSRSSHRASREGVGFDFRMKS